MAVSYGDLFLVFKELLSWQHRLIFPALGRSIPFSSYPLVFKS